MKCKERPRASFYFVRCLSTSKNAFERAINQGFNRSCLLYSNTELSAFEMLPSDSVMITCPAAISHSMVGPILGYISALPSAIKQSFNELPAATIETAPYLFSRSSINWLVSGDRCERLATTLILPE